MMAREENKALVQRFIEEVFNAGNVNAIAEFCVPGSLIVGGLTGQITAMKTTFPDNHLTIEEMVAEGNKVVVRASIRGTNIGPMLGLPAFGRLERPVPPTGRAVVNSSIQIFTIKDDKIVSLVTELDQIGLLQQLGWTIAPPAQT